MIRIADIVRYSVRELLQAPLKAAITIVSFAIATAVPVFVFGISAGMTEQVEDLGKEPFRRKVSVFASLDPMRIFRPRSEDVQLLKNTIPNIEAVGAVEIWNNQWVNDGDTFSRLTIYGVVPGTFEALGQKVVIGEVDQLFQNNSGDSPCLLNDVALRTLGLQRLPTNFSVNSYPCRPIGVVDKEPYTRDVPIIYFSLETARRMFRRSANVNRENISVDQGFQSDSVNRIAVKFADYDIMVSELDNIVRVLRTTREDFFSKPLREDLSFQKFDKTKFLDTQRNLEAFLYTVMLVIILFIVLTIGANTYHAVRERMGQILVQVALGARTREVAALQAAEILICLFIGIAAGVLLALNISEPFGASTNFRIRIDTTVLLQSIIVVFVGAVLASIAPILVIARLNPSDALKS